jgi:hypothetical protein
VDLIQYVTESADPSANFPTPDEVLDALKAHLNKKENLGALHDVRNRLLIGSRRLLANTIKLNKLIDQPNFEQVMANLTGQNKLKGYWASKLISIPLLKSAVDQLAKASNGPGLALAISRIMGVVEDAEAPVQTPYEPRVQGGEPEYHHVYKYLTKMAGWPPAKVREVDEAMAMYRDRLVKQMIARLTTTNKLKLPRPAGW